tara:strand:- start:481 stop:1035 length:555 start_codon:yes stop_codon:yes gene_type:complete
MNNLTKHLKMETVKSTKKIELNFNERGFEKAVKANEGYVNSKKELIDTIDSYGVKGKELIKEAHIYKATAEAIYTLLSKDSHLPEGINKLKFLELFNIDLSKLSESVNKYIAYEKFSKKPLRADYVTYLTEDNLDDYNSLNELIVLLNKLDEKGFVKNKLGIQNSFANRVSVDFLTGKFKFNSK